MARKTGYGVVGLLAVLIAILVLVPFLKRTFPRYYPDGFQDAPTATESARVAALLAAGQRDSAHNACIGVTCPEGQFCQEAKCIPIYPRATPGAADYTLRTTL